MLDQTTAFATSGSTTSSTYISCQFGPNLFSSASNAIGQELGYTGRRHDVEDTGLMYFRARYYSEELGRFVSRDPLGTALDVNLMNALNRLKSGAAYEDGMSLYMAYFAVNGMDPLGLTKGGKQRKPPTGSHGKSVDEVADYLKELMKDAKKNAKAIKEWRGWLKIMKAAEKYGNKFKCFIDTAIPTPLLEQLFDMDLDGDGYPRRPDAV